MFYIGVKNGLIGEPSNMIDRAWHTHILNTRMYFNFCQLHFGYYLHHVPSWSAAIKDLQTQTIVSSQDFQIPLYMKLKI